MVELLLKGMLRKAGVEPPKWHDVGKPLIRFADRFPEAIRRHIERLAAISSRLRKERELAFYGDIDFIPTEEYGEADARQAMEEAGFVYEVATLLADPGNGSAGGNHRDAGSE